MAVLWDPVLLYCCFFIVITMGQKEVAQTRCVPTDEVEFQPSTLGTPIVLLIMNCQIMLLVKVLNFWWLSGLKTCALTTVTVGPGWREGSEFSGESLVNYGEVAVLPPA